MASPQRVSFAKLRVGIMASVAMLIAAVLIFLLTGKGNFFERTFELRTFMDDSSGMAEGTMVRLNGIQAGTVDKLRLSNSKDPARVVEILMTIPEDMRAQIPDDSVARISASNLLGEKFVNITKGSSPTPVKRGAEIRSVPSQDIPELMAQSAGLLQSFQGLLKRVDGLLNDVEAGKGNLGKFFKDEELYARLNAAVEQTEKIITDLRTGNGTLSKLMYDDALYKDVRGTLQRLNDIATELQQGKGTAGKLLKDPALFDDLRVTTGRINKMLEDLDAGKGTAGKLLKDEELYRQINQLLGKVDTTIDKLNSGQGTLGQLMVNPQLYDSLKGVTGEMNALLKDVRANPKKFLRIKLAIF